MNDRPETPRDPDYRFTLANERTYLAWLRTALALLASGVAVAQLVPEFAVPGARHAVGIALSVLGVWVAAAAVLRWRRVQRAMECDADLPASRMPLVLGTALALVGVAVGVLLSVSGGPFG
jgi:putative membrane protein